MNKTQVLAMTATPLDSNMNFTASAGGVLGAASTSAIYKTSAYDYWQGSYYPYVIKESYPVYIQERALDKGKQAFEIIKMLKDKKIIKLNDVGDFVDAMDELIKIL